MCGMKALCCTKVNNKNQVEVKVIPKPIPNLEQDEALIKIKRAGVCNTDLEIVKGYMGFEGVLGHEFVGVVEQTSEKHQHLLGKRVCGDINVTCNNQTDCSVCCRKVDLDKRRRNHCPNRRVIGILGKNGVFAEYINLPVRNLHIVPDDVTDEEAAFAEPLAAALRIAEQQLISSKDAMKISVLGDGKLGLLIAAAITMNLRESYTAGDGAKKVILFGRHSKKMDLLQKLRTNRNNVELDTVDVTQEEGQKVLKESMESFDVVIDATGNPEGVITALSLLHPLGTLVLKSTCAATASDGLNLAPIVIKEVKVIGSRCGPIDSALELLSHNKKNDNFDFTSLIDKVYPLQDITSAFEHASQKGVLKIVIDFDMD